MIREMSVADIPKLLELARLMHGESSYKTMDFNESKVIDTIGFICSSESSIGLVAESDGQVVGMFGGYAAQHFFGDDLVAMDLVLYVTPEHRGGMLGIRMLKQYIAWAKSVNAKDIRIGITTQVTDERTGKIYGKLGFNSLGQLYRLEE